MHIGTGLVTQTDEVKKGMPRRRFRSKAYNEAYDQAEANAFARYLLVPSHFLREDLKSGPDLMDDNDLKQLAAKYKVPMYVMAIRVHEELEEILDEME